MPALPELREPLRDGVIALRPTAERDIPETLIAYQDDPSLHLRLGAERPPSGAELGRACEEAELGRLGGLGVSLTIVADGEDVCLGQVNLHRIDWENLRGELGLWLAPGARGRGFAPRALRLIAVWIFDVVGLARIELRTETDNAPMRSAARSAGFAAEGTLRGYTLEHGQRVDNVMFSLLPGEVGS